MPEHFHAHYANMQALVSIKNANVIRGALPTKQLKLVLAWCELHRDELMKNWESARQNGQISKIDPIR